MFRNGFNKPKLGRQNMTMKFLGRKKGMTRVFDSEGRLIAATVISAEPGTITQLLKSEKVGYSAVQVAFEKIPDKKVSSRVTKPLKGLYKTANVQPHRFLKESRIENEEEFQVGQSLDLSYFKVNDFVDIMGTSKGKGYQGVMKLHGFKGGPGAHGSGFHRHAGSTGMRSTPGRCLPGSPRASRMGGDKMTVQNLKVLAVDPTKNILVVKGAVPGSKNSVVYFSKSRKKVNKESK